jgi:hypothetical protein
LYAAFKRPCGRWNAIQIAWPTYHLDSENIMTPIAKTHDDDRWPISLDTDSGRVFLTADEAESLYHQLYVAFLEIDLREEQKELVNAQE